jgi:hypothetical protein
MTGLVAQIYRTSLMHFFGLSPKLQFIDEQTTDRDGVPFNVHLAMKNENSIFKIYLACKYIFISAVSIGNHTFLSFSAQVFLQLQVDAILVSTFVIRLVFVPGYVIIEQPTTLPATPKPSSSAIFLSSSSPVVEVASPGAIFGNIAETL